MEHYKLCYVDGNKAYFTDNFEKQWGDDWNDRPYECNAGEPYEHWFDENDKEHPIKLKALFFETNDWSERKPCDMGSFSVRDMLKGAVAWLHTDTFNILAGTNIDDFIKIIEEHGGKIYVERK